MKKLLLLLLAAGAAVTARAQWQYNGVGGFNDYGLGPLAYPRNLKIATTNDSTALVVQKPAGGTNDILEAYHGSVLMFQINSNGAIGSLGSNSVTQTQGAIGIESGTSSSNIVTFPVAFLGGTVPIVTFVNTNYAGVISLSNVTASGFTVNPVFAASAGAPTNKIFWTAIGIPSTVTH